MRRLLEGQRAVWQRLEQRAREKEQRRDRLHDQLRMLWMQMVELDVQVARGSQPDPEITGSMRALCKELEQAGEALMEAEALVAPRQPSEGR